MLLNDSWTMMDGESRYACSVPCSAMQVLLREGVIPDPYYRENEWISTPVSERDFTFEKAFVPDASLLQADQVILSFEGIDTLGLEIAPHSDLPGGFFGSSYAFLNSCTLLDELIGSSLCKQVAQFILMLKSGLQRLIVFDKTCSLF